MSGIIMHDFDVGIAIPERQRLAAVVARAVMNAGGFGPCGLIFVDSACPLLGQGAGLVAVGKGRQCADRHGRAFCCQVVHNQFRRWGDDGDPVVGADGGDARIAEYFTCRGCQVLTDVEDSSAGRDDDTYCYRWSTFALNAGASHG